MKFFTVFVAVIVLLSSSMTIVTATNPRWDAEIVDTLGVGEYSSIVMNTTYDPCISYRNITGQSLKYASHSSPGGWTTSTVDSTGDVGYYTSLALDSSGYPHISYYDNTGHDLKFAEWTGSTWTTETVDSDGDVGKTTSLAIDRSGNPWISYYDKTNTSLKCAVRIGTMWIISIVDNSGDVGSYTSLALDGEDDPHISYYDTTNTALKYAEWIMGGWAISTVDNSGEVGRDSSLALDGSGNPHISYYDATNTALKYAKWTGSTWDISTVDNTGDVGTQTSMVLYSYTPWISYYDSSQTSLKCAAKTGATWLIYTVDSDPSTTGTYPSMAIFGGDQPAISYYTESGSLKFLHRFYQMVSIGVFRPSTHTFYLDFNGNDRWDGAVIDRAYNFGLTGDIPVSGEWLVNSVSAIGTFRPSTHTFYLDYCGNGRWDGAVFDRQYNFGLTEDLPISGIWNADGLAKIGTFRPSTHTFYLDYNGNGRWDGAVTDRAYDFGLTPDLPVSGEWNGVGMTMIGVYRPSTHTFYLDYNGNGRWDGAVIDRAYDFGLTGDQPVSGDWAGFGRSCVGVYRPSTHTFYLDYNGNGRWDGAVIDRAYDFGLTGDSPVAVL